MPQDVGGCRRMSDATDSAEALDATQLQLQRRIWSANFHLSGSFRISGSLRSVRTKSEVSLELSKAGLYMFYRVFTVCLPCV